MKYLALLLLFFTVPVDAYSQNQLTGSQAWDQLYLEYLPKIGATKSTVDYLR
ncbi:hypothetical protein [Persicitalea sp.]|uniref:hypothetical protein n=1 Tax=Persicitalea sp. TaxID=3100273 RepID=UPI003592E8A7